MSVILFSVMWCAVGIYLGFYLGERHAISDAYTALKQIVAALEAIGFKPWSCNDPLEQAYACAQAIIDRTEGGAK